MSERDLADLERQQRQAYWKGEATAQRRLPAFLPQDPLQGLMLQEAERIDREVAEYEEAVEKLAWEQYVSDYGLHEGTPAEQIIANYGEDVLDQTQDQLDRMLAPESFRTGAPSPRGGYHQGGFRNPPRDKGGYPIGPPQTYETPATHMAKGPKLASNIPEDLRDPEWEAMVAEDENQ